MHTLTLTYVTHPETGKVYPVPAGGAAGAGDGDGAGGGQGAGNSDSSGSGDGAGDGGTGDGAAGTGAGSGSGDAADGQDGKDNQKPPWGSDEEFKPEKAWRLVQNLRAEIAQLKPQAAKAKELEDADKSEAQKAADRAAEAEQRADKAEAEAARLAAAIKHGLTDADLELLEGVPADKVEERAKLLADRLKATDDGAPPPRSRRQGGGGTPPKPSVAAGADRYAERKNKKT